MPLALEHGEERWGPIQAWLAEVGNDGLQRALSGLDKDRDYHAWLSEQLGQSTEAVEWGAKEKKGPCVSLRVACRSQLRVRLSGRHSAWTQKENEGPRPCWSMASLGRCHLVSSS